MNEFVGFRCLIAFTSGMIFSWKHGEYYEKLYLLLKQRNLDKDIWIPKTLIGKSSSMYMSKIKDIEHCYGYGKLTDQEKGLIVKAKMAYRYAGISLIGLVVLPVLIEIVEKNL
jgi:hypothetical protein